MGLSKGDATGQWRKMCVALLVGWCIVVGPENSLAAPCLTCLPSLVPLSQLESRIWASPGSSNVGLSTKFPCRRNQPTHALPIFTVNLWPCFSPANPSTPPKPNKLLAPLQQLAWLLSPVSLQYPDFLIPLSPFPLLPASSSFNRSFLYSNVLLLSLLSLRTKEGEEEVVTKNSSRAQGRFTGTESLKTSPRLPTAR